jgi:dTDP-4-amino-4,6-dideoxygalactose transaminase
MPMIGRRIAPAGAPIRGVDLARWCRRWHRLAESGEEFRSSIRSRLGRRHCWLVSTGRAGLTVLLSALRSISPPDRDEVILPSYTCYSVPASTVRAGLRPRIVDIDPRTLDFDLERLGNTDFRRVLAIVPTSLYGLPSRLDRLSEIARDHGVYLVDDAAQSLGASLSGRPAGAWGDAALLSFDKGKAVSAIDAGAILVDADELATAVERQVGKLRPPRFGSRVEQWAKVAAYAGVLRPSMYWLPDSLPGLGLGRTEYRPDFVLEQASPWLAALGATMWPRLEQFVSERSANASRYRSGLQDVARLSIPQPVPAAQPSYLRFPVLVSDSGLRERLLRDLKAAGIGATRSYPQSIADIPELQALLPAPVRADGGRMVAAGMLTLPTHPFVASRDIELAVGVIRAVMESGR